VIGTTFLDASRPTHLRDPVGEDIADLADIEAPTA